MDLISLQIACLLLFAVVLSVLRNSYQSSFTFTLHGGFVVWNKLTSLNQFMYFLSLLIKMSDALTTENSKMSFFPFGITFNLAKTIESVQKTKQYLDLIAYQPIFFKGVFLYCNKAVTCV